MARPKLTYAIGNAASTTLASGMTTGDTTAALTSSTSFDDATVSGEGMVLLDEGTSTEELAYSTGVSGGSLTVPLANRGLEGGSAQAHSSGASVKGVLTVGMWNDLVDSLANVLSKTTGAVDTTKVVTLTGTQTLTNKTLTSPKIGTAIADTNGNEIILTPATASAVNEITVTNAATTAAPTISASGGDTNIDLTLSGKGTGEVKINAAYGDWTTDTDAATVTFNMATTNKHRVTLGGNRTLAVSNVKVGQSFVIRLLQDGTGSRTVTWFSTIKWAGGTIPTLTTTLSKADVFGFLCTSASNYDGFVIGQNL